MSFGFDAIIEEISLALQYARDKRVVVIASASNTGAMKPIAWPARLSSIVCMSATCHDGTAYQGNPGPVRNRVNLAVLGVNVPNPDDDQPARASVCRTGTSTAAPIAAGIAAIIITMLKHCETKYAKRLSKECRSIPDQNRLNVRYRQSLDLLTEAAGVEKALLCASENGDNRFDNIVPWRKLDLKNHGPDTVIDTLLKAINAD